VATSEIHECTYLCVCECVGVCVNVYAKERKRGRACVLGRCAGPGECMCVHECIRIP